MPHIRITRLFGWIIVLCLLGMPTLAQDERTPYERALAKIEQAKAEGATRLDLSWMDLTELPPEIGPDVYIDPLDLTDSINCGCG